MPSHASCYLDPPSGAAFSIYWVVVALWLVIIGTAIIAYIQNSRTFVATRLLLAVVAIDTSRTPRVNEKRVGSFPGVPKMAV
jgi:hypothetical protein